MPQSKVHIRQWGAVLPDPPLCSRCNLTGYREGCADCKEMAERQERREKMSKTYESLREIKEAMDRGELNREHWWLIVTEEAVALHYVGGPPEGMDVFSKEYARWAREKHREHVFACNMSPAELLPEALELAGIESEWV